MTGEISLRGHILPVGGIKEKVLAAYRGGIEKVLLPAKNKHDLDDIPKEVKSSIEFILVDHVDQAFEHALMNVEAEVKRAKVIAHLQRKRTA